MSVRLTPSRKNVCAWCGGQDLETAEATSDSGFLQAQPLCGPCVIAFVARAGQEQSIPSRVSKPRTKKNGPPALTSSESTGPIAPEAPEAIPLTIK